MAGADDPPLTESGEIRVHRIPALEEGLAEVNQTLEKNRNATSAEIAVLAERVQRTDQKIDTAANTMQESISHLVTIAESITKVNRSLLLYTAVTVILGGLGFYMILSYANENRAMIEHLKKYHPSLPEAAAAP
jgi:hypothetical protein